MSSAMDQPIFTERTPDEILRGWWQREDGSGPPRRIPGVLERLDLIDARLRNLTRALWVVAVLLITNVFAGTSLGSHAVEIFKLLGTAVPR